MKIAQVSHNYLPHIGGIEFYIKRIVESLKEKGIVSDVLTTNLNTPLKGRKSEAKYFKVSFSFMRNPFSFDLISHLKKNNYDILHLHNVWFLPCLTAVYFRKNARIITTMHGVYPDKSDIKLRFFLNIYKPFASYILSKSEKVIVLSNSEKKKLETVFKVHSNKIVVIPNGINIEKNEVQKKKQTILFTGRIIPDKNPDLLIKAVALLNQNLKDSKIVFVGSIDDSYRVSLINLSKKLCIKNEIIFVDKLDPSIEQEKNELMGYYMNAAVFVSLGSWEGLPTRLMEAMQYNTPVIAYDAGGSSELVIDNKNGLIIRELDEKLLADKLEKILLDGNLSKRLGYEARRTIENGYSWDLSFEKIFDVYKN